MGNLWWAEAVIPVDREPDWTRARRAVDEMTAEQMDCQWVEYINQLTFDELASVDFGAALALDAALDETASVEDLERLLPHVRTVLNGELERVIEVLGRGQPWVCAFEAAGHRVFVHCSGYSSGSPDALCDAWLNVEALGLLETAGFVKTTVIDGGV